MDSSSVAMRELSHSEIVEILDNYRKRTSPAKDAELVASIKQHGIIQPVCVRPRPDGGYALIFGSRRLRANRAAGHTTIPALIRDIPDSAIRATQLIENGQREDAHPMEEAEAFSELLTQRGSTVDAIARQVGKSEKHVRLRLKLCELAEEVRTAFFEDKLTTEAAYLVARIPSHDDQRKALAYIIQSAKHGQPMAAVQVHAYIEHTFMLELRHAPFDPKDANLVPQAGACGSCPKQTGNQRDLFGDVDKGSRSLCTDAACFRQKLEATYLKKAEQAFAKGHEVLSPEESAKLFPHGSYLAPNSEYIDLDLPHPKDPERRPWRQLLRGQKVPQVLAIDHHHRTHDLVLKVDAETALASADHDFLRASSRAKESSKQEQREQRKRMEEARAKQRSIVNTIVERAMQQEADVDFWRLLVTGLLQGSWHDLITELVKRRGLFVKGQRPEEILAAHIKQTSAYELLGIALELVVTRASGPHYVTDVFATAVRKYAPEFAADLPEHFHEADELDDGESALSPSAPDSTDVAPQLQARTPADPEEPQQPTNGVEPSGDEPESTPKAA